MNQKSRTLLALIGIIAIAMFFRVFHFGDWMHYQLDQARDFRIIHAAIEYGAGELPLQGPKAAGSVLIADADGNLTDRTTLRLGPLFYYIEYLSAILFGDTPVGSIILLLVCSIATVPIFYLVLRRFFGVSIALALTAIVAGNLFFVVYSRFGWNPNLMPFFMLLFIYSLLQVTSHQSQSRHKGWWLVIASVALAFVGHMHFLAFISAPIIGIVYLLWTRPRIALVYWILSFSIFFLLQTPLIINDVKTGGENSKAFLSAVRGKSDKKEHTFVEKCIRNITNHTKYFWVTTTGDQRAELPILREWDIRCDHSCRHGLVRGGIALLLLVAGIVSLMLLYRKESDDDKKNFLRLILLWYGVVFLLYIPLAYDMAPRFFLLHGLVNIILLGLVLHRICITKIRWCYVGGRGVLLIFIISNIVFVSQYFSQVSQALTDTQLRIPTDYILKEKTRITFAQMEAIISYIQRIHQQDQLPVFLYSQAEYKRAFWERLDTHKIPRFHATKDLSKAYRNGHYFLVVRTQSDARNSFKNIFAHTDIIAQKAFGTLTVYQLQPKEEYIIADNPTINVNQRDPKFSSSAQVRYLWRQVIVK